MLYELCCHAYPFPATEEAELEYKVLHNKMEKIPHSVNLEFVEFINKMLKKEAMDRPSIEEIIYNDVF
jgi:serine/threonine protein kinase